MKKTATPPTTLAEFLNPSLKAAAPNLIDELLEVNETVEKDVSAGNGSFGMSMINNPHLTTLRPILKKTVASPIGTTEPSPIRGGKAKHLTFAGDAPSALSPPRQFAEFGSSFQRTPQRSTNDSSSLSSSLSTLPPSTQRVMSKFREGYAKIIGLEAMFAGGSHNQYHHEPLAKVTSAKEWETHMQPFYNKPLDPLLEGQVALLEHQAKQHMMRIESVLGKPLTVRTAPPGTDSATAMCISKEAAADKLFVDLELVRLQKGWEASRKEMEAEEERSKSPVEKAKTLNPLRTTNTTLSTSVEKRSQSMLNSSTVLHPGRTVLRDEQPSLRPMVVTTHATATKRITGKDIVQRREEEAEAARRFEQLQRDPKVQRQKRWVNALDHMQQRAELLRQLDSEQTVARAEAEAGRRGKRRTAEDLIAQWRKELQDTADSDEKQEARDRARAYRKAVRAEKDEARHVADVLSGMTSVQLADKRQQELEEKERRRERQRWRITRVGTVDVFDIPRWSSKPCATLRGDVTVEELEMRMVDNIPWILIKLGWVPVHLCFGGFTRTQLFAETPGDEEGNGALEAMFEELDDVHEKVLDAVTLCPIEQLKGQTEIKEIMKQMESTRQGIRDLPGGRRDMIRQLWDEMQKKGSADTAANSRESAFQREMAEIEERVLAKEQEEADRE